jgi:hypothetical protein
MPQGELRQSLRTYFLNILSTLTVDRRHVLDELCTTVDGERVWRKSTILPFV